MEIKHQVFVSSTFKDLIDARKEVSHALLELDCIPSGMELFPAADEDAWTLIKGVIDSCDYYVLIIAGKYGSTNKEGISYTEMEYDYAVSINKPIIVFPHEKPEDLPGTKNEKTEEAQKKLAAFREKTKVKHCKSWFSPEDLGGKVSRSIVQLRISHPSPGWIPGKYAASESLLSELQELRAKVNQYELQVVLGSGEPPEGSENLAQGSDSVVARLRVIIDTEGTKKITKITSDWDTVFSYIGPSMMNECTDEDLMSKVSLAYLHALPADTREFNFGKKRVLPYVFQDVIRVQFQALGLIAPGIKKRAVADKANYWRSTPYGEKYLLNLTAVKRPVQSEE